MTIIKPSTAFKAGADWVSAEVRAYIKDQVATHVDAVSDVRDNDFEQTRFVYVRSKAALYRLDMSSAAADDGDTVLRDNVGRRYVKVPGSDGNKTWNVQVDDLSDRDAYDNEDSGFVVLVSDVGDGRAAIYTMGDGGYGDWSGPAYQTGPAGGPGPAGDGFNPAGAWDVSTTYDKNDMVSHNDRSFVSFAGGNVGNEPPDTDGDNAYWQFVPAAIGPKGEKGDKGDPGEKGDKGDPGNAGANGVSFIWRGAYSGVTTYAKDDVVLDNGSSWVALQETTGNAPPTLPTTSNVYWELLAAKGTDGVGTGDVVGPASSTDGVMALFDGTSGKSLKAGSAPFSGDYDDLTGKPTLGTMAAEAASDYAKVADLGDAAALDVGTTAGTVAAGDDSRITGALQASNVATFQQFNAATADKVLEADSVWGSTVTLTDAATIAWNLNAGYDFKATIADNRALGAATNIRDGKKGVVHVKASGATRTLTLDSSYKLWGGVETGPYSITTTEKLQIAYLCEDGVVEITSVTRRPL